MDWSEYQEYYDLIAEEIAFTPKKGQKWLLTLEERHTYDHDVVFHVYSEKGETMVLVYEIEDVMNLELKERLHKLSDTLSGNFRIHISTLRADLPEEMGKDPNLRDGSAFKLSFQNRKEVQTYEWDLPKGEFKRIRPVLKLIWAVDKWRPGSKAMGWDNEDLKKGKGGARGLGSKSGEKNRSKADQLSSRDAPDDWGIGKDDWKRDKDDWDKDKNGKGGRKGRLDPFGNIW